jgi:hypothetical protein
VAVDIDIIEVDIENVLQLDLLPNVDGFDSKIDTDLTLAIEHLEASLDDDLWIDGLHLDAQQGHKVFSEHRSAVQKLIELLQHKNIPGDVQEDCQNAIGKLALMDGILAKTAVEDVITSSRMTKQTQHQSDMAEDLLEQGFNNLLSGDESQAINNFRQSWQHSQNVK